VKNNRGQISPLSLLSPPPVDAWVGPFKGTDPQNYWQQQATPVKYGSSDRLHALLSTLVYVAEDLAHRVFHFQLAPEIQTHDLPIRS
jgi:hypothetical protein